MITRFILYSFKNLKSLIGIAIDVIVIEDLEVKWSRSTCVFNLIIGIWGIGLVFHCYLDLDLQWIGLNCWGWVRVADWLFIFWININWLSLQTIAFVFFFVYSWNGAALPLQTNGYIRVDCYGGLNQMRRDVSTWRELLNLYSRSFKNLQYSFAAFLKLRRNLQWFQFCDGVGIARLLNATLVLPKFEVASYWNETRQFTFPFLWNFSLQIFTQNCIYWLTSKFCFVILSPDLCYSKLQCETWHSPAERQDFWILGSITVVLQMYMM